MFTRPDDLADDAVAAAVADGWGLRVGAIEYLPVGFGSHHWLVETEGRRWFVTADDLRTRSWHRGESRREPLYRLRVALTTAGELFDDGLSFVVAPIATNARDVLHVVDDFAISVYPYVQGESPDADRYATRAERRAVLELIVAVHRSRASANGKGLVDDFAIQFRDELTDALADRTPRWDTGPYGEPSRLLLARHAGAVERALNCYDRLATAARERPERIVLTHGEPHPRNTLVSDHGLRLIDWDTVLRAPPERDLWILADGDPQIAREYEATTGMMLLDDAMTMYRLRWDLTEISIYIRLFRETHRDTTDTLTAWGGLNDYLDPRRWPDH